MKLKLCKWKCGRKTDRRCGICLECCTERDRRDKAITAGTDTYLPPEQRPGHRFSKRKRKAPTPVKHALLSAQMAGKGL